MRGDLYVQYGCGFCAPEAWQNFDYSPTLRFERLPLIGRLYTRNTMRFPKNVKIGDIVKGLPIADGSAKAVYCSHVLEHLSLEDCRAALRNTYRMLEPGGTFRMVVPDLRFLASQYLADDSRNAAMTFMRDSILGTERRLTGLRGFVIERLRKSAHLWMWDEPSMAHELAQAGFVNVRRAHMGDSPDPRFADVETADRWDNCLGMEAMRPTR